MPKKPDEVRDADMLMRYIIENAPLIYVREIVNGSWESISLKDLPGDKAIQHAFRFLQEGRVPHRLRTPDEEIEKKE